MCVAVLLCRAISRGGPGRRCDCCIKIVVLRERAWKGGRGHGQRDDEGERGRRGREREETGKQKREKMAKSILELTLSLAGDG